MGKIKLLLGYQIFFSFVCFLVTLYFIITSISTRGIYTGEMKLFLLVGFSLSVIGNLISFVLYLLFRTTIRRRQHLKWGFLFFWLPFTSLACSMTTLIIFIIIFIGKLNIGL